MYIWTEILILCFSVAFCKQSRTMLIEDCNEKANKASNEQSQNKILSVRTSNVYNIIILLNKCNYGNSSRDHVAWYRKSFFLVFIWTEAPFVDRLSTRAAQEITNIKTLVDGSLVMTFGTRCDYCTVIYVPKYGVTEVGSINDTYCLSLCDCFKDKINSMVSSWMYGLMLFDILCYGKSAQ